MHIFEYVTKVNKQSLCRCDNHQTRFGWHVGKGLGGILRIANSQQRIVKSTRSLMEIAGFKLLGYTACVSAVFGMYQNKELPRIHRYSRLNSAIQPSGTSYNPTEIIALICYIYTTRNFAM